MQYPASTYRIQFRDSFTFSDAEQVVPYLERLGITCLYASPISTSRTGSSHGYDVVEPGEINPELGGRRGFEKLSDLVRSSGLDWMQDIVPNHMAFDSRNKMLMDVLESGTESLYFQFFDVEWDHPYENLKGRLLAPVLGKLFHQCLEDGEIKLEFRSGGFEAVYFDHRYPLRIESYSAILGPHAASLARQMGEEHPDYIKFLGVLYVLRTLASVEEVDQRGAQILFAKRVLWELYQKNQDIQAFVDNRISFHNGEAGNPESFDPIDRLLSEQNFRFAHWKLATQELNYRRFFTVNDLISLRAERQDVFDRTHGLIRELVRDERIQALRIDHIDGLFDPLGYLERLREFCSDVVVEKILEYSQERLPEDWPCTGTTGYDFLNWAGGLLVDSGNEREFGRIYGQFIQSERTYSALLQEKKRLISDRHLAGDVDRLALAMQAIVGKYRYGSDIALSGLRKALTALLAAFPVYRTYIRKPIPSEADREFILEAIQAARTENPGLEQEFDFLRRFLLLEHFRLLDPVRQSETLHAIGRFQQLSGPLMAKGVEDTFFYVYNRLIALNEVGGNPARFGVTRSEFHNAMRDRAATWPRSLNASASHDTKRGEDARARLYYLSEIPKQWRQKLKYWTKLTSRQRVRLAGGYAPDRNDEYFLYQVMLGHYPMPGDSSEGFAERLEEYLVKAAREAKVHSGWVKTDEEYEAELIAFARRLLSPEEDNHFLPDFLEFHKRVAFFGVLNSLVTTLVKATAPGTPDIYQGTDLWDFSFVDPDNRRAVDYDQRRRLLKSIEERWRENPSQSARSLAGEWTSPEVKLFTLWRALQTRRHVGLAFDLGTYKPLRSTGTHSSRILSFMREHEDTRVLVVCPLQCGALVGPGQLPLGLEVWGNTKIHLSGKATGKWKDAFTEHAFDGADFSVGELLRDFPMALLVSEK